MKRRLWFDACASLSLAVAFVACDGANARAQATAQQETTADVAVAPVAAKFDEYGKIGHCDWSARLDNFAVELQNRPDVTGYIIVFDETGKNSHASWRLKVSRHYLVNERGLDASRVVVVHGGHRDTEGGITELWIVPQGVEPPVAPSEADRYAAKDFSGKFDSYETKVDIYRETVEMGYTSESIARSEFADKLKAQPASVGYLVIRAAKNSAPGLWRRIARRDENILHKDHAVEAARLKSINGGYSDGEDANVELWILPKNAPPPAGVAETSERVSATAQTAVAFKLNTHDDVYMGNEIDSAEKQEAERWVLENLAEMLRADPRATGYIIARERDAPETTEEEGTTAAETLAASSPAAGAVPEPPQESNVETKAKETSVEAETTETPEVELSMKEVAESWKKTLSEKYGIASHRIIVVEGRPRGWATGRLTTWVVPEKAQPPDPLARDADEAEEAEEAVSDESAVELESASEAATSHVPPRR